MAEKHTKRELFQTVLVLAIAAESEPWVIEGLEHEVELLDRKRASKGVDAKRAAEQLAVIASIESFLGASAEPLSATAIAQGTGYTVQRVSAMLKKMGAVRHEDGKKVTFSLT